MIVVLLAVALAGSSWREGGTGVVEDADPPVVWSADAARWTAPLPARANGSPVALGDQVCVVVEPTTVQCHAMADGRLQWSASNEVVATLPGAEAAALRVKLAEADAAEATRGEKKKAYAAILRDARREGSEVTAEQVDAARTELDALDALLAEVAPYRTTRDKAEAGYASPTPVVVDGELIVAFGHGVVARYGADGTRRWIRWLGPHAPPMNGYDVGASASPVVIDGVVILGYNRLTALDADTGATRWEGPEYRDYGTPAVGSIDGIGVVITPAGELVRASDGLVMAAGLGAVWFVGPILDGADLYLVGAAGERLQRRQASALAWRLSRDGDTVRAEARWSRTFDASGDIIGHPVVHDGRIHVVTRRGRHVILSAADGTVIKSTDLAVGDGGSVYGSPTVAGDRLYVPWENGTIAVLGLDGALIGVNRLPKGWTTPLFRGDRMWFRSDAALYCLGR